jgi:hypothetical protein
MSWNTFLKRWDVLNAVVETADQRLHDDRRGELPLDVPGVDAVFATPHDLLGALSLRWHTRLAGRIERELMSQPMDLQGTVVAAWQTTANELPGIRAILDRHRDEPLDERMEAMMGKATRKERELLAVMSGLAAPGDPEAPAVGERIEMHARATNVRVLPRPTRPTAQRPLLDRVRSVLAS